MVPAHAQIGGAAESRCLTIGDPALAVGSSGLALGDAVGAAAVVGCDLDRVGEGGPALLAGDSHGLALDGVGGAPDALGGQ